MNDVIERYKKYLTNAQIKELAAKAERYKLLNAQNRANAQNSILAQQRQTRRGLQNVGLASREGKVISGVEASRNDALAKAYDAYNQQLQKVEEAQTQNEAVRMANANIAAQQRRQQEAILAQQQAQAAAAQAQREKTMLTGQVRDKALWNQQMTDGGDNAESYRRVASNAVPTISSVTDAAKRSQEAARQTNPVMAFAQQHMRQAQEKVLTQNADEAMREYTERMPEWDKAIKAGEAARNNKVENPREAIVAIRKELTARREMSATEAKMARANIARTMPGIGNLVILSDDDFAVRYDAAKKLYESEVQRDRQLKYGANNPNSKSKDAAVAFAMLEQAKKIREMYSPEAYFYDTFNTVESAKKYDSDAQEGNYAVDVKAYDREHGTEKAKYAAIVNELSKILTYNDKAYRYTFRGKLDKNPQRKNFELRIYNDKGDAITQGERTEAAKIEKVNAVLVAASYMTDDERKRYNSILEQAGEENADKYFEHLYNTVLIDRVSQAIDEDYDAMLRRTTQYDENGIRIGAEDSKNTWLAQASTSVLSVPVNILEGVAGPINTIMQGQRDPVAARLAARRGSSAQEARNAVQENFGEFGRFAYGTVMSMADSASVAAISGGLGKLFTGMGVPAKLAGKAGSVLGGSLLGGSAFNSAYSEALQRGLTPEKARLTAVGQGINEMLFESLSLDLLVSQFQQGGILKVSKNGFVNWVVNTLVQGGVEGSEEVFTDIANNLWDNGVNKVMSEEMTKLVEYVNNGMSYDEAKRKVDSEYAGQLGLSFLGGFVSGGVMGGGATFMGMVQNRQNEKLGKGLRENTRVMDELKGFEYKSEYAQEIQKQGKWTNQDIADLFNIRQMELLEQYQGDIQQAVKDGRITQEDAALLEKFQQNNVQVTQDGKVIKNENGVTAEEYAHLMDEVIPQIDTEHKIQFLDNAELAELTQAVGGKVAAALDTSAKAETDARKAFRETVASINADESMTDEQKKVKIEEARQTRDAAIESAKTTVDKALKTKGTEIEVSGNSVIVGKGSGKVTFDFSTKDNPGHQSVDSMTATEQSALRIAKIVAASRPDVNVKVEAEFVGEHANENGYYDRSTNTIHINMSGDNSVLWTLSHELTHHLANTDTEAYAALRTAIETTLKDSKLTTTELEDRGFEYDLDRVDPYIAREGNLWDALVAFEREEHGYGKDAEEEVVARCCESFLGFDQFVKDFAHKHYKSARAVNKFIAQMNIDMQRVSEDARQSAAQRNVWNDESPENQILRQLTEIDRIANLWRIAVNAEAKKRQAAREETRASTKDSVKRSDAEYLDLARRYESGDKSVEAELRKAVHDAAERNGYVYLRHTSKKHRSYNDVPWQAFVKGLDTDLEGYGRYEYVATANGAIDITDIMTDMHRLATEFYGNDVSDEEINPSDIVDTEGVWDDPDFVQYAWDNYFADIYEKTDRVPAIVTSDGMIVLDEDNSRVKSADLVERDNNGNIIPLSERFNTENEDIRYSTMDKVRLSTADGTRTYTDGDVTAKLYGNYVELDGGKVRQRVQMMEAIAEVNGTARVDAASEEEAEAFRRAGAEQVVEELEGHGAKYGTWEFKYEERKFTKDSRYDIKQKQKFAKSILKQVGKSSGFTYEQRVKYGAALGRLMDYLWEMQYGKMDGKVIFDFADRLFDSILNDYTALSEADEEFRSELLANMTKTKNAKGSTVYVLEVNDKQMREIKYAYENAMAYASKLSKALGARVAVKQTESAKTLEDIFTNSADTRIKSDTNEGDMPGELLRIAQETESRKTNPYAAESEERQALKMGMFEAAMAAAGVEKSTAQQIREAVKAARAEERAKARKKIAERDAKLKKEFKATAAKREARLKQKFKETTAKANETRLKRDMRTIALKWNQRLVKLLANPTEASHVPIQLAREVAELTKTITEYLDSGTERGRINLEKVIKAYQKAFDDQATIAEAQKENPKYDPRGTVIDREMYDEYLVQMMNRMNEIVAAKSFKDLTADEMKALLDIIRGVAHTVYDANRMIGTSERKAIWEVGDSMIHQFEDAPDVKLKGYLETSLDLRRLARIFSGSNDNAEFVKLVERLNDGAIEKERIAQVLQDIFAPVTEKYGAEIRKWYGKKAEWIDTGITQNGKKVEITKGMRVSLAMHVLNAGNMNHIAKGGITIPNREMYNKGKMTDAYANGETVQLSAEQIEEIISHMTEAEKAYVEAAKEFFHKRTGYYVNKTSLQLLGYRKATVENYFPIHTDKNFTKTDFASLQMDGSIEGQGFLKERVNASNPVHLEDITSVVNRQIRGVALYAGLAVPMRNFNAVMNSTEYFEDENGAWRPRTTVRKAMTQKMGEYGAKVVKGFLEDASEMTHVDVSPMERFAGKLARNYVQAVLLGNLKVAMKQVASYPTAAAVIPWKYLGKALLKGGRNGRMISRADVDLINQYTPLYQMRREGQANEIASIMAKRGMEQKLPWLLGWITKMDVMTVGRLWSAAEYMVADQQKNLPVGSDEYYKAVAKVFNDTIQQTQPNFTPLQRNAALRSKNPVVRSLVLFGTQRMQNGGILTEATMELAQSKGKSKEEIKAARQKLGRAVVSQIVQNILLIAAELGKDFLLGRMLLWQDDDEKKVTYESLLKVMGDKFLSNMMGSFLGGSEIYSLVSALFKKATGETAYDTEFTVPALDAAETILNFVEDLPDVIKYLTGDHTDEEKLKKAKNWSMQIAKAFGYATGIPLENAVKDLFKGVIPAIKDHVDYFKTGEFPQWWLHQSGKLDKKTTNANYKEWTNNGFKGSEYFYWENVLSQYGKREEKIPILLDANLPNEKKAMLLRMMDKSGATSEGTVVYKSNGDVLIDFANPTEKQQALPMPTAETEETTTPTATPTATPNPTENPLTDARQEGVKEAVAKGVPEQTAFDAFLAYQNIGKNKSDDYSRNDDFRAWLFANVTSPEQRAILEYQVIGTAKKVEGSVTYRESGVVFRDYTNESWFKLSEHSLSKDGTNKRYEAGKRLEKTGLSVDKTVNLYDALAEYTKKSEWTEYLKKQGLTDEQIQIFLWSRGWAKLK